MINYCAGNSLQFQCFLFKIQQVLNSVLPVLIALGVIYFVWGVVQYVINDSEEAKKKGKDRMIFGIIGLAIILSLWGLVYIIVDTFNLDYAAPDPSELNQLLPPFPRP